MKRQLTYDEQVSRQMKWATIHAVADTQFVWGIPMDCPVLKHPECGVLSCFPPVSPLDLALLSQRDPPQG